jgi:hypothetical protein
VGGKEGGREGGREKQRVVRLLSLEGGEAFVPVVTVGVRPPRGASYGREGVRA